MTSTETLDESLPDSSQMLAPGTPPVQIATVRTPDPVHTDAKEAVSSTETLDKSLRDSSQALAPETSTGQMATVNTSDSVHTDTKEAVSSSETLDECLVPEVCIDQPVVGVSTDAQARHRQGSRAKEGDS